LRGIVDKRSVILLGIATQVHLELADRRTIIEQ
jgi:hypothetical protein